MKLFEWCVASAMANSRTRILTLEWPSVILLRIRSDGVRYNVNSYTLYIIVVYMCLDQCRPHPVQQLSGTLKITNTNVNMKCEQLYVIYYCSVHVPGPMQATPSSTTKRHTENHKHEREHEKALIWMWMATLGFRNTPHVVYFWTSHNNHRIKYVSIQCSYSY